MSNIDQAFINAYSDPALATAASPHGKYAVREPGPTLRVFTQTAERDRIDQPQPRVASKYANHSAVTMNTAHVVRNQTKLPDSAELTLPSLVGERKPLSAFTAPKPTLTAAFKPVYEVDEFRWPAIIDELVATSHQLFAPVLDLVFAIAGEGHTLIGIGGAHAKVGTSTITMCLARLIAESGRSIALVDGNFMQGDLARTLGLEFNRGWEDVLAGNMPLTECAVVSLTDKMTLIPLGGPAEGEIERLSSIQSSVIAGMLRFHHDVVLFDLGTASEPTQLEATRGIVEHCRLDAGIIVATVGARDPIAVHGIDQLSGVFGPLGLGVIGNRAS